MCLAAWAGVCLLAFGRAVAVSWCPLGDHALIAIRSQDVFTAHHPLLGTAASVAVGAGVLTNHPGPLLFYLAALPVRALGMGIGLALATALINVAAGALAIVFANRQAGVRAAVVTTGVLAVLVSSYGNSLLVDPYNPTVCMLACFALLVLCWAVVNGDLHAVPWLVAVASFCLQTNLAYSIVIIPLLVGVSGWCVAARRRDRSRVDGRSPASVGATAVWVGIVAFVLWLPPIIEQVINGQQGNLALLVRAARVAQGPLPFDQATERAAAMLTLWPAWGPGGFNSYPFLEPGPNVVLAAASLVALAGALGVMSALLSRRGERATARAAALGAGVVVLGWIATARTPLSPIWGFAPDYVRWLWPIGAFSAVAGVLAVPALVGGRLVVRPRARMLVGAAVVGAVILLAAPSPTGLDARWTDGFDGDARTIASELVRQLGPRLEGRRPLWEPWEFYPVVGFAFVAGLREAGYDFAVADPILVRQFGERRAGDAADAELVITTPVGWQAIRDRAEALAFASTLSDTELGELEALLDEFSDAFAAGTITLNADGEALAHGQFGAPWMLELIDTGVLAPEAFYRNSTGVATLLERGSFDVPLALAPAVVRLVELSRGIDYRAAAIVTDRS